MYKEARGPRVRPRPPALPFLLTEEWEKVYALCVDDRDRATWAGIDAKLFKGQAAVEATAKLFERKP